MNNLESKRDKKKEKVFKMLCVENRSHLIRKKEVSKIRKIILSGNILKKKEFILFRDKGIIMILN